MHEMAIVTSIVDAICEKAAEEGAQRVVSCTLSVGEVRDIHEELLQKYFDWFSKDTPAEGVRVIMNRIPLRYECDECGRVYGYRMAQEIITGPEGEDLSAEIAGKECAASEEHPVPDVYHANESALCGHGQESEINKSITQKGEHVHESDQNNGRDHGHTHNHGHTHTCGQQPHCLDHPAAKVNVVSGLELFIEEIGII